MTEWYSVAEAYGLIYPHPFWGENFSFVCVVATQRLSAWSQISVQSPFSLSRKDTFAAQAMKVTISNRAYALAGLLLQAMFCKC